jgi:hypothetical protein
MRPIVIACRARCLALASWGIAFSGAASAEVTKPATLPGAPQIGVGCAFYANVPALTRVSGIQIVDDTAASRSLISSIYGLRRGDFEFRRAFDKEVFFELFGIPSKGERRDYADLPRVELLVEAEHLITGVFEPALERGDFISLRARGTYGGPHNVLLLGRAGGKYQIHDPLTGAMRTMGRPELARNILSESKQGTKVKKRYFSSYHLVSVSGTPGLKGNPLRIAQLPEFLSLRFTEHSGKPWSQSSARRNALIPPMWGNSRNRSPPSTSRSSRRRTRARQTSSVRSIANFLQRACTG